MKSEVNKEHALNLVIPDGQGSPSLYQVYVCNDDFTPMDFVALVLEKFFNMERRQAIVKMQEAHQTGRAMCGVFGKDIAETRVEQVLAYARLHEHPLCCRMEAA